MKEPRHPESKTPKRSISIVERVRDGRRITAMAAVLPELTPYYRDNCHITATTVVPPRSPYDCRMIAVTDQCLQRCLVTEQTSPRNPVTEHVNKNNHRYFFATVPANTEVVSFPSKLENGFPPVFRHGPDNHQSLSVLKKFTNIYTFAFSMPAFNYRLEHCYLGSRL